MGWRRRFVLSSNAYLNELSRWDIALSIACKGDASCYLYGGVTVACVERNGVFITDVGSNESLSNVFSVKVLNDTL